MEKIEQDIDHKYGNAALTKIVKTDRPFEMQRLESQSCKYLRKKVAQGGEAVSKGPNTVSWAGGKSAGGRVAAK